SVRLGVAGEAQSGHRHFGRGRDLGYRVLEDGPGDGLGRSGVAELREELRRAGSDPLLRVGEGPDPGWRRPPPPPPPTAPVPPPARRRPSASIEPSRPTSSPSPTMFRSRSPTTGPTSG